MIRKTTDELVFTRDEVETILALHIKKHGDTKDINFIHKQVEFNFVQGNQYHIGFDKVELTIRDKK